MEIKRNFVKINDFIFVPYLKKSQIEKRIKELSKEISNDYKGRVPVFLIVLKGSVFFATKLLQNITVPLKIETLRASSYRNEMVTSGKVELLLSNTNFENQDLIVIEDIIDTGTTMKSIINSLKEFKPNSIEIASLLIKPKNLKEDIKIKYIGFAIPPDFVIGYGLDYAEFGRNLQNIYILKE